MRAIQGFVALWTFLLISGSALGFKQEGHDIIEAAAYRKLLMLKATATSPDGKQILADLIARGVLEPPKCFPYPDWKTCEPSSPQQDFLPPPNTGSEDLILTHQFSSTLQCFHYMAEASDIYTDPRITAPFDAPPHLAGRAQARCLRFLTTETASVLSRRFEALQTYAVMHAIEDSFSEAHVIRDPDHDWAIQYLKPWQLTAWAPYIFHPSGFSFFCPRFHHEVADDRDDGFYDPACKLPPNAYLARPECLTERAKRARDAVVDYLVLVHSMPPMSDEELAKTDAWRDYLNTHFRSAVAEDIEVRAQDPWEHEWSPGVTFGARVRGSITDGYVDTSVSADIRLRTSQFSPLRTLFGVELGSRLRAPGKEQVSFPKADPVLALFLTAGSVPITTSVMLGLPGVRSQILFSDTRSVDLYADLGRLDFFRGHRLWVGIDGLRYSLLRQRLEVAPSFAVGTAFGVDPLSELYKVIVRNFEHVDTEGPYKQRPYSLEKWNADPWIDFKKTVPRRSTFLVNALEGGIGSFGGQVMYGVEPLWRLHPEEETSAEAGFHVAGGVAAVDGQTRLQARVSTELRVRLNSLLLLVMEPLGGTIQIPTRLNHDPYLAAEGLPLGIGFEWGDAQVVFEGPRFRIGEAFKKNELFALHLDGTPTVQYAGLRLGLTKF